MIGQDKGYNLCKHQGYNLGWNCDEVGGQTIFHASPILCVGRKIQPCHSEPAEESDSVIQNEMKDLGSYNKDSSSLAPLYEFPNFTIDEVKINKSLFIISNNPELSRFERIMENGEIPVDSNPIPGISFFND